MKMKLAILLTVSVCLVGYFVLTARADEREIDELRDKAAALIREYEEHLLSGHAKEARAAKLRAIVAEREADAAAERDERREHEERERHEEREGHESGPEQIEHIRIAAEHLHAAGMHELAEDLMHQAEERERDLARANEGHRDAGLQRHVEELTRHVEGLTKHVEEQDQRLERIERAILELSDRRDK